jgi:fluoride exporter
VNGERDAPGMDLPVDPDAETRTTLRHSRPLHLRWRYIVVVAVGGAIGTALRAGLSAVIPTPGGVPVGIFLINISGAFLLGVLLEVLARRGPDEGRRRLLRLFLGTGVTGGYTTYSSLADDGALLLGSQPAIGLLYVLVTVVVGAVATYGGIRLAASLSSTAEECA